MAQCQLFLRDLSQDEAVRARQYFFVRWTLTVVFLLVLGSLMVEATSASAYSPIELIVRQYSQLPLIADPVVSPNGDRIAYGTALGEQRWIQIYDRKVQKRLISLRLTRGLINSLGWIDDQHLLIMTGTIDAPLGLSAKPRVWRQATVLNVISQKQVEFSPASHDQSIINAVTGEYQIRQRNGRAMVYLPGYYRQSGVLKPLLFVMDPDTGLAIELARSESSYAQWLIDDLGNPRVSREYSENKHQWNINSIRKGNWVTDQTGTDSLDWPELLGFTNDDDNVLVRIKTHDERLEIQDLSLSDGTLSPSQINKPSGADLIFNDYTGRIFGSRVRSTGNLSLPNPDWQRRWETAIKHYPASHVTLASYTPDFTTLVLLIDNPDAGLFYDLFDVAAETFARMGSVLNEVNQFARAEEITYPASDGTTIPAVLTQPRGLQKSGLPLIVLAHDGPWSYVTTDFSWLRAALAASGYAVLEPNFRGSALSSNLERAGFGQWGRAMQTDLSDGVRFLSDQGLIDPKRVCIAGASYGGYAALAGVTLQTGIYRCAISIAGISDLSTYLAWKTREIGTLDSSNQRWWARYLGLSGASSRPLDTISPLKNAEKIEVPVLLLHDKDDLSVPYSQSLALQRVGKSLGKNIELINLREGNHVLSTAASRKTVLQNVLEFLRKNNPP